MHRAPTGVLDQAVLQACPALVYETLDQSCGLPQISSVQAFSFTEFASLFLRPEFAVENGMPHGERRSFKLTDAAVTTETTW
jgi:hypothetical protein